MVIVAVCLGVSVARDAESKGPRKDNAPAAPGPQQTRPGAKKPGTSTATEPARQVALPEEGTYSAAEFLKVAGKLWQRPVRLEGGRIRKTRITITPRIAGASVGVVEMKLLLAAHRVHLFEHVDPKTGKVLVATRDANWQPRPERFTAMVKVPPTSFASVWARIEDAVKAANDKRPKGKAPVVAVPAKRRGKIFLRASSPEELEALTQLAEKQEKPDPDRPRFYTYVGKAQLAQTLLEQVLGKLSDGEQGRLRIVTAHRGNRLLYRAPREVGDKVTRLLEELDRR